MSADDTQDLYIFGYGSVIWKRSEIPHLSSTPCFVRGYSRRFWHGSPDHRGTIETPGRVVSLYTPADMEALGIGSVSKEEGNIEESELHVHGVAFRVTDEHRKKVIESLDQREIGGYIPVWLPVFTYENNNRDKFRLLTDRALTYVAPITNRWFLGFASHKEIANQVIQCTGSSGPNIEYVLNLHYTLEKMGFHDNHITGIVSELKKLIA